MFQEFPYTDMHQLNLDWIVKISKDFLDQYTHIQQLISDGETSLQNTTAQGIADLNAKATALEAALQAWYNTHSVDIANQLTQALADMATALQTDITSLNSAADAKLAQVLESIPADYSELSQRVSALQADTLSDLVITSNNFLDSRSGENLLPAQMNGKIFYFGAGFNVEETFRRQIKYQIHIEKEDHDLNAICNKWVYKDGSISSAVNVTMDADLEINNANIVGIQMICYGNATVSNIKYVGMYAHVPGNPTPTYDRYSESVANWSEYKTPIAEMIRDFEFAANTYNAGIVPTNLVPQFTTYPQYYQYWDIPVNEGEYYGISGTWYASGYLPYILCKGDRIVYIPSGNNPANDTPYENIIEIPRGVDRLIVNNEIGNNLGICGKVVKLKEDYWKGKKIVWFGTSISAGKNDNAESYPVQIGQRLGAKMYNESLSSSCVRAGSYTHSTTDDPMGWGGMNAYSLFLSLSLSSAEKQQIIDQWAAKWINIITIGADQVSFTDAWITIYKNASWDIKLAKYLSGGSVGQCDLYVFDTGYNDMVETVGASDFSVQPAEYSDRRYFAGAMDFIIRKILDDNPRARILIIGHYNNGSDPFGRGANFAGSYVCEGQKTLADKWGIPIVETWNLLGLSMMKIGNDTTPVIYARYPDHLHPNSDTTGTELKRYAEALVPYVKLSR